MTRLALAAALLLSAAPAFASDETDMVAVIVKLKDAMNKNDNKTAASYHSAASAIIDEIPPHLWSGAGAYDHWAADYDTYSKAHGDTDPWLKTSKPRHVTVSGDRGYAVVPALYTFKEHGKKMREHGLWTFAMQKVGGEWKVAGWGWAPK